MIFGDLSVKSDQPKTFDVIFNGARGTNEQLFG